mmetsp:Transcript_34331/g.86160  ORF Transcript_34331/g.86160 Transcript_34331/m.86160 type:complete len:211 (-) Transcript_34331:4523-5155(-)
MLLHHVLELDVALVDDGLVEGNTEAAHFAEVIHDHLQLLDVLLAVLLLLRPRTQEYFTDAHGALVHHGHNRALQELLQAVHARRVDVQLAPHGSRAALNEVDGIFNGGEDDSFFAGDWHASCHVREWDIRVKYNLFFLLLGNVICMRLAGVCGAQFKDEFGLVEVGLKRRVTRAALCRVRVDGCNLQVQLLWVQPLPVNGLCVRENHNLV